MKKTVIFGTTAFSYLIQSEMEMDGVSVAAFTVNKAYLPETWDNPIPLVPFEDLRAYFGEEPFEIIVSVGYKRMNERRKAVFEACDAMGYEIGSFVHSTAICKASSMGRGNIILPDCVIHRFVEMGDGNIFANNTVIGHETKVGSFNFFAGITTGGLAAIGDHCFLGMKSIVCNDISVGDYTLLGAGTVLSKNSNPYTMIYPAKNRTLSLDIDGLDSMLV